MALGEVFYAKERDANRGVALLDGGGDGASVAAKDNNKRASPRLSVSIAGHLDCGSLDRSAGSAVRRDSIGLR